MATNAQIQEAENLYKNSVKNLNDLRNELKNKDTSLVGVNNTYLSWKKRFDEHIVGSCKAGVYDVRVHPDRISFAERAIVVKCNINKYTIPILKGIKDAHQTDIPNLNSSKTNFLNLENEINELRDLKIPEAEKNVDLAYKKFIDIKKASMTAQELSEYNNIGVDAQRDIAKDRNKTFAIIGVSFVTIMSIGYFVYRRYLS